MSKTFEAVKDMVLELEYPIIHESAEDGVLVLQDESAGLLNTVINVADPLLVIEQYLFDYHDGKDIAKQLLQKNRDLVSGSLCLDGSGVKVLFRDTLQLASLDQNELEGSINSLELLLGEYSMELIEFSKH